MHPGCDPATRWRSGSGSRSRAPAWAAMSERPRLRVVLARDRGEETSSRLRNGDTQLGDLMSLQGGMRAGPDVPGEILRATQTVERLATPVIRQSMRRRLLKH